VSKLAAFRNGYVTLSQNFRGKGSSLGNFFGFYKTRHILLSNGANCTVLRTAVLTQYRRVTDGRTDRQTDGRTDGIAIANTALAKARYKNSLEEEYLRRCMHAKTFYGARKGTDD